MLDEIVGLVFEPTYTTTFVRVGANIASACVLCPEQATKRREHTKTNSLNTMKLLSERPFPSSDGRPGRGQCDVVTNAHTGQVIG